MNNSNSQDAAWFNAKPVAVIKDKGAVLARVAGKQIALFDTAQGFRACDNRCPHEGYPLSEGLVSSACTLTCNWHNWKFNLNSGDNLFGGDQLRTYPVEVRGADLWIDLTDPPFEQQYQQCVDNLRAAFEDHSYDRIARELARLIKIGADPLDAFRLSIQWSWKRLEFGWTHGFAGMADWLTLFDEHSDDREAQLVCLVECVAHVAEDVLREGEYPYTESSVAYDEAEFLNAIERENESSAMAYLRGALKSGKTYPELESAFTHAALAHYNDFGHSLIYVSKVGTLIERLGQESAEPLFLSLVRSLIYARREEKIPEFRHYSTALAQWGANQEAVKPETRYWHKLGIEKSLDQTNRSCKSDIQSLYRQLLLANATNMLNFDISQQVKTHVSVPGNVNWLDFTHALTFSNAVRKQCAKFPELWPQGIFQMACFNGRNAGFTLEQENLSEWQTDNIQTGFAKLVNAVLDHGLPEYIVSVHWLKTVLAAREECEHLDAESQTLVFAATNRFSHSPLKRRHARRTAYQSLKFVDKE